MRTVLLTCLALSASAVTALEAADAVAPEGASKGALTVTSEAVAAALAAKESGQPVEAQSWMIAAANPHAVEAGAGILRQGGTAADAMVAVQSVLGLVEPQSSGLGGGAFLVWYDAKSGAVTTLDARETAPLAATPRLFQDENGEPLKFFDAVVGGRSVGTPGTLPCWRRHAAAGAVTTGPRCLRREFRWRLRACGFAPHGQLGPRDAERLARFPATSAYFLPDGTPLAAGAP